MSSTVGRVPRTRSAVVKWAWGTLRQYERLQASWRAGSERMSSKTRDPREHGSLTDAKWVDAHLFAICLSQLRFSLEQLGDPDLLKLIPERADHLRNAFEHDDGYGKYRTDYGHDYGWMAGGGGLPRNIYGVELERVIESVRQVLQRLGEAPG